MLKRDASKKEQRKGSWQLLLVCIGVVLVVGIGLLAWQLLADHSPQAVGVNNNPHFSATTQTQPGISKSTPPDVALLVRQQIARRFQLSVEQLTTKLQAGTSIDVLAAQQGMAFEQWRTFVIATYQAAYTQEETAGKVTQVRSDVDMRHLRSYPADALNNWVTADCLGITA